MGPYWEAGSSRNILVHVITVMVKVHFTIFIAVNRRRTWNTCSCFGTENHISYTVTISYTISGTILRTLQKDSLYCFDFEEKPILFWYRKKTVDMYTISRLLFDFGYDIVLLYRDIRTLKVNTLMSYMILGQCRDIRISKFSLWYQRFCRYRVQYAIPGAAGRTGHVPALLMGPDSWSSNRLDGLYSWEIVLTPLPAGVPSQAVAAVVRPWCVGLRTGHGEQSWFEVIVILVMWLWSTWCQSSMLSACHWYSA